LLWKIVPLHFEDYLARLASLARFSRTLPERLARRDLHFEDSSHFTSKVFTLHLKVFTKALHTSPRVFTLHIEDPLQKYFTMKIL
jgi:hypothetical protein